MSQAVCLCPIRIHGNPIGRAAEGDSKAIHSESHRIVPEVERFGGAPGVDFLGFTGTVGQRPHIVPRARRLHDDPCFAFVAVLRLRYSLELGIRAAIDSVYRHIDFLHSVSHSIFAAPHRPASVGRSVAGSVPVVSFQCSGSASRSPSS